MLGGECLRSAVANVERPWAETAGEDGCGMKMRLAEGVGMQRGMSDC